MPRVQIVENAVPLARMTDAKIATVDNGGGLGGAIGGGLRQLGAAGVDYAEQQDAIHRQLDEAATKTLDNEFMTAAQKVREGFLATEGLNAGVARPKAEQSLSELRQTLLGKATTKRMRDMLDDVLTRRVTGLTGEFGTHTVGEISKANDGASLARISLSANEAAATTDPDARALNIETGLGEIAKRGEAQGWSGDAIKSESLKFTSGVHKAIAEGMLLKDDVDGALAYRRDHDTQFTAKDAGEVDKMLHDPLERRDTISETNRFMGVATAGDASASFSYSDPLRGMGRQPVPGGKFNAARDYGGHKGADIPAPMGAPVHASMPGTARVSSSKLGGNIVTVDDGAGHVTRYMHLGKVNIKDGDQVTPDTVIGAVGVTGRSSGPHLHYEVMQNGKSVDPEKVIGTVQQSPRRHDLNAALARVDQAAAQEGWTPEKLERVKEEVQRRVGRDEMLQRRTEEEAERSAYDAIDNLGGEDKFTSLAQLPPAVRAGLSPQQRVMFQQRAQSNVKQTRAQANGDIVAELRDLATDAPEDFVALDLRRARGQITTGEYNSLERQQRKLRAAAGQQAQPVESKARGIIRSFAADIGLDLSKSKGKYKNAEDRAAAERIYTMMVDDLADDGQGKKALTEEDYTAAFRRATQTVKVENKGWLSNSWEETERFRVKPGTAIRVPVPTRERDAILASYRSRYPGKAPLSEQQIAQIYMETRE